MLDKRVFFLVSAVLSGCFSNNVVLEPKAQSVTLVHDADRPLHCKFLAKINGTSRSSDEQSARTGAENDVRNQAAELNGNFAEVVAERTSQVGTSSQRDAFIEGKALLCQTEAMDEANEKAEAKAKEDKAKADAVREEKEAEDKLVQQQDKKDKKSKK